MWNTDQERSRKMLILDPPVLLAIAAIITVPLR